MEIILISLSVISTLSTVCLFILIVIMNKAVNDLKNDVSTIKTDERIDLINIEAKALAMKINSLETVFYMNGDSTLDVNAPEWLISNKKVKKYFSPDSYIHTHIRASFPNQNHFTGILFFEGNLAEWCLIRIIK